MKARPVLERFEEKYSPCPMSGCWFWNGPSRGKGYGYLYIGSRSDNSDTVIAAHRMAYILFRGEIPDGLYVCHTCDVPCCVNPAHLFLGTNLDNVKDKVSKNRQSRLRGELGPSARLTGDQVIKMRTLYAKGQFSTRALAALFGISASQAKNIVAKRQWTHLS